MGSARRRISYVSPCWPIRTAFRPRAALCIQQLKIENQRKAGNMVAWDKTDIIHFLSDLYGYSSHLEVCTPTTGGLYHKIDRSRFKFCHRLMYRCPASHDGGMDVNFRSPDLRTAGLFETIQALGLRYDIVLVDSFHSYDASYRDLADALRTLTDRGTVVVHDCLPPTEGLVGRDWTPGSWCGVTFMAYIDFLNDHPELASATVDADFGCGIVRKGGPRPALSSEIADGWRAARGGGASAFRFMTENKDRLLNLMSADAFRAAEHERAREQGVGAGGKNKRPRAAA